MSVYTSLTQAQIKQLLGHYQLGIILAHEGISDGIENTNYRITTTSGQYILTIFEQLKMSELPYFLSLLSFLRVHALPVPEPIADINQQMLMSWQSKPAAIFACLPGHSLEHAEVSHCQQIGHALGQLHGIGQMFPIKRANAWGMSWMQKTAAKLLQAHQNKTSPEQSNSLSNEDAQLLAEELKFQQHHYHEKLPLGVIHADLFRDNALFENNRLSAIVDFYTASHAPLLFDLAITLNDWCIGNDHYLDSAKARALITAYQQQRPLQENEKQQWYIMLRAAALRFWLSRLMFQQANKTAELTLDKDPDVLKCLLLKHRENKAFCLSLLASTP